MAPGKSDSSTVFSDEDEDEAMDGNRVAPVKVQDDNSSESGSSYTASTDANHNEEDRKMPSTRRNTVPDGGTGLDAGTIAAALPPKGPKRIQFPRKLRSMLEDAEKEGNDDIISWLPDGLSFRVFKPKLFSERILPRYVRQSNYRSFQRQLYLYGFRRIHDGPSKNSYQHPKFKRDDDESEEMVPQQSKRRSPRRKAQNPKTSAAPRGGPAQPGLMVGGGAVPALQPRPHHEDGSVARRASALLPVNANEDRSEPSSPVQVRAREQAGQQIQGAAQFARLLAANGDVNANNAALLLQQHQQNQQNQMDALNLSGNGSEELRRLALQLRAVRGELVAGSSSLQPLQNRLLSASQLQAPGGLGAASLAYVPTVPSAVPVQITTTLSGQSLLLAQHQQQAQQLGLSDRLFLSQAAQLNSAPTTLSLGMGGNSRLSADLINRLELQRRQEALSHHTMLRNVLQQNQQQQAAASQQQAQLLLAAAMGNGGSAGGFGSLGFGGSSLLQDSTRLLDHHLALQAAAAAPSAATTDRVLRLIQQQQRQLREAAEEDRGGG